MPRGDYTERAPSAYTAGTNMSGRMKRGCKDANHFLARRLLGKTDGTGPIAIQALGDAARIVEARKERLASETGYTGAERGLRSGGLLLRWHGWARGGATRNAGGHREPSTAGLIPVQGARLCLRGCGLARISARAPSREPTHRKGLRMLNLGRERRGHVTPLRERASTGDAGTGGRRAITRA